MTNQINRQPVPPNPIIVEALVDVMSRAALDYLARNGGSVSDVFSATLTLTHRTIQQVLYHTTPQMSVREMFQMRSTVIKGIERLWSAAAGGGSSSKFGAH